MPSAARKRPPFQRLQYRFAAHLRHPQKNRAPAGIEERRLQIYRELFYNNIEDFLANAYPVLRRISSDAQWHARVRDFYAHHRCREPQFYKVAGEFLEYLTQRGRRRGDPPYLLELCHYEWVELALSVSELELAPDLADPDGDLLRGRPRLSPLAWMFAYEWPVHRIGPGQLPARKPAQPTYLVINRNRGDVVRFMEINPVTARLLELLQKDRRSSGRALLLRIAGELRHPHPEELLQTGAALLQQLRERDVILGTRR